MRSCTASPSSWWTARVGSAATTNPPIPRKWLSCAPIWRPSRGAEVRGDGPCPAAPAPERLPQRPELRVPDLGIPVHPPQADPRSSSLHDLGLRHFPAVFHLLHHLPRAG